MALGTRVEDVSAGGRGQHTCLCGRYRAVSAPGRGAGCAACALWAAISRTQGVQSSKPLLRRPLVSRATSGGMRCAVLEPGKLMSRSSGTLNSPKKSGSFPGRVLQPLQPPELWPHQQPDQTTVRPVRADASQQSGQHHSFPIALSGN